MYWVSEGQPVLINIKKVVQNYQTYVFLDLFSPNKEYSGQL